jgi:hypothetical protein
MHLQLTLRFWLRRLSSLLRLFHEALSVLDLVQCDRRLLARSRIPDKQTMVVRDLHLLRRIA